MPSLMLSMFSPEMRSVQSDGRATSCSMMEDLNRECIQAACQYLPYHRAFATMIFLLFVFFWISPLWICSEIAWRAVTVLLPILKPCWWSAGQMWIWSACVVKRAVVLVEKQVFYTLKEWKSWIYNMEYKLLSLQQNIHFSQINVK